MGKYGIYVVIGLLAFLVGTATVFAAPKLQSLVISSEDGARHADVSSEGRLFVDVGAVTVSGLPDPANVVNLFVSVTDDALGECTNDGGLNFQVPSDKVFLLTDMEFVGGLPQGIHVWSSVREVLFENGIFSNANTFSWRTPLLFYPDEIICLSQESDNPTPTKLLLMGVLSPVP